MDLSRVTYVDGRFELVRMLGAGGMGEVYEANDVFLERRVALKFLAAPPPGSSPEHAAAEARALALVRDPHVPIVHTFGFHRGTPFIVMELIEGVTLAEILDQHLANGETLPLHLALQIAITITSAIGASHAAGVLHRDIKSENVIIEQGTGRPVLVDFGIAVRRNANEVPVSGTPANMAPELLRGQPASVASDLYSLGCLVYELFTGVLPFRAATLEAMVGAHLNELAAPCSARVPHLAPYDAVVARALAKRPEDRFPTCAAFLAALREVSRARDLEQSGVTELIPSGDGAIRILVVDDDPVFAKLATRAARVAFADIRVTVSRAKTGRAAVANAERTLPQLLLLDYRMPDIDGVEVLSRIRALPQGDRVKVVVISGDGGDATRWRFSSLGVQSYLAKPVTFTGLVERILAPAQREGWVPLA